VIVVDSNIIVYLHLAGPRLEQARQLLREDAHWAAPLLWRSEFRNVLALYVRKGLLTLAAAQEIMDEALRLMAGREYEVASSQVLRLAASSSCSAYDCEFVALAQDLGVALVTVDQQVLDQFPEIAVSPDRHLASRSQ
jgi:predicted nucleic acid-binding protein